MTEEIIFKTRDALINGLEEDLRGHLKKYKEDKKSIYGEGWIKTQLIEYYFKEVIKDLHNSIFKQLQELLGKQDDMSIRELNEEFFYLITYHYEKKDYFIYVDAEDPRFWVLYSKLKSENFDRVLKKITSNTVFDRAWFPTQMLDFFRNLGAFRGYGGRFSNEFFLENENIDDNPKFKELSFKSWGQTERLLNLIRNDKYLKHEFALTNIRIKKFIPDNEEGFILDDIVYTGKFTSIGNSFIAHRRLVDEVRQNYRKIVVDRIENELALTVKDGFIEGNKLTINLPQENNILNIKEFVNMLFSGRQPFMLWGLSETIEDNFARVNAVDMHIGKTMSFDIFKDKISVYISKNTCGNTIARFYTLLQQTFGSMIQIQTNDYKNIFSINNGK